MGGPPLPRPLSSGQSMVGGQVEGARASPEAASENAATELVTSDAVSSLEQECPAPECGAGVFMANHFDRHYCGKCGLTYVYENK